MVKALLVILCLQMSHLYSQDFVTKQGEVIGCDSGPICFYFAKNMSEHALKGELVSLLSTELTDQEGRLDVCHNGALCWPKFEKHFQDKLVGYIKSLDDFALSFNDKVVLRFELYSMTNTKASDLSLKVESYGDASPNDNSPNVQFSVSNFVPSLNLNPLDKAVNMSLGGGISKGTVSTVYSETFSVQNFDHLDVEWVTKVFVSPGSVNVKELIAGIDLSGSIVVPNEFNGEFVKFENFKFEYGYLSEEFSQPDLPAITVLESQAVNDYVVNGHKFKIIEAQATSSFNGMEVGIIDFKKKKGYSHEKIVGYITPYVIPKQDIIDKIMKNILPNDLTKEDIDKLPVDGVSLSKIMSQLEIRSSFEQMGVRYMHLDLDRGFARKKYMDDVLSFEFSFEKLGAFKKKYEITKKTTFYQLANRGLHFNEFFDQNDPSTAGKFEELLNEDELKMQLHIKGIQTHNNEKLNLKFKCAYHPHAEVSEAMVTQCSLN